MMTRDAYCGAADLDRSRRMSLHHYNSRDYYHLAHADRSGMHSYPLSHMDSTPSSQEQESEGAAGSSSRRRIAVACARCRKRKIKCSGDPGDGRGCENCRTANQGACNFYRVSAMEIHQVPLARGLTSEHLAGYQSDAMAQSYDAYGGSPTRMYSHQYARSQMPLASNMRGLPTPEWSYGFDSESQMDPYSASSAMSYVPTYGQYTATPTVWPTAYGNRTSNSMYSRAQAPASSMQYHNTGMMQSIPTLDSSARYGNGLVTSPYPLAMQPSRQLPIPSPALRSQVIGSTQNYMRGDYYGWSEQDRLHSRNGTVPYTMHHGLVPGGIVKASAGLPTPEDGSPKSTHGTTDPSASAAMINAANALTRYATECPDDESFRPRSDDTGEIAYTFTQDTSSPKFNVDASEYPSSGSEEGLSADTLPLRLYKLPSDRNSHTVHEVEDHHIESPT